MVKFLFRINRKPQNPAGFRLCNSSWSKTRRVLGFTIHHGAKPGGFWALQFIMEQNPAGFRLCNSSWSKTRRVLGFAIHHGAKPGGFWALQFIMEQNPAGFRLCNSSWSKTRRVLGSDLSSFLVLIQEKKQKKIKASPRPGNLAGYMIRLALQTFPAGNDRQRRTPIDWAIRSFVPLRGRSGGVSHTPPERPTGSYPFPR